MTTTNGSMSQREVVMETPKAHHRSLTTSHASAHENIGGSASCRGAGILRLPPGALASTPLAPFAYIHLLNRFKSHHSQIQRRFSLLQESRPETMTVLIMTEYSMFLSRHALRLLSHTTHMETRKGCEGYVHVVYGTCGREFGKSGVRCITGLWGSRSADHLFR